jgi:hypothetical protein
VVLDTHALGDLDTAHEVFEVDLLFAHGRGILTTRHQPVRSDIGKAVDACAPAQAGRALIRRRGGARRAGAIVEPAARQKVAGYLAQLPRDRTFANGRTVRNLFERLLAAQASRLNAADRPTDHDLRTLAEGDVTASLEVASSDAQYPGYV